QLHDIRMPRIEFMRRLQFPDRLILEVQTNQRGAQKESRREQSRVRLPRLLEIRFGGRQIIQGVCLQTELVIRPRALGQEAAYQNQHGSEVELERELHLAWIVRLGS